MWCLVCINGVQRRTSATAGEMLKKPFHFRRTSAGVMSAAAVVEATVQSCTIRFLDDSEPMSITFKVGYITRTCSTSWSRVKCGRTRSMALFYPRSPDATSTVGTRGFRVIIGNSGAIHFSASPEPYNHGHSLRCRLVHRCIVEKFEVDF